MQGLSFGDILKAFRKQKRLSQSALANKLGVHRNTISSWEQGTYLPDSRGILVELAKHLHLSEQETRALLEASLTMVSFYWQVPFMRNPFFTGRENVLAHLHTVLTQRSSSAALTQSYAMYGLGGIGKTQVAIEYAYQHRYDYEAILWIQAETQTTLVSSFVTLAEHLSLFEKTEEDQSMIVAAVLRWLNKHKGWLLIFDNVEDLSILKPFLPTTDQGALLLTTRLLSLGTLAQTVELSPMKMQEGHDFLLARTKRPHRNETHPSVDMHEDTVIQQIVSEMEGLPLALEQAGAYIEETGCGFENYLQLYKTHRKALLARRGTQTTNYPNSVATTWSLSFHKIEQSNPAAAELLQLCAFLAPDNIPEELLKDGAHHWPPLLQQASADPLASDQMLEALLAFSLVKRFAENHRLSIHRLVQVVQMDMMSPEEQRQWAERVISAMNAMFPLDPRNEIATWPQCLRYLEQVQACNTLIQQWKLTLTEAADLLHRTGIYLSENASYVLAESLYLHALSIREQQLEPEHHDIVTNLSDLAILYRHQGKYEQAELLFQRLLPMREKQLGLHHPEMARSLNSLAVLYYDQGKYEQAEPLYLRALSIREQQLGPEHPSTANTLNNLALLYYEQGKYEQAEPLYLRALAIHEQQLEQNLLEKAKCLDNLASLYCSREKYEQAEPLYLRALSIREQQLGPEHPSTAITLNNLASLYCSQEKYEQAEPLYLRALSIREQQLGPEHPSTAVFLNNLADLYQRQGKYEQAEPLYLNALVICQQHLGPQHPFLAETFHNLAVLRQTQQRPIEALSLFQQALVIREQVLGLHHLKTNETRTAYTSLLQELEHVEASSENQKIVDKTAEDLDNF